jgi:uncharacterized protein with PIN domain
MSLDASALTAILAPEEDGEALAERLAGAEQCFVEVATRLTTRTCSTAEKAVGRGEDHQTV